MCARNKTDKPTKLIDQHDKGGRRGNVQTNKAKHKKEGNLVGKEQHKRD